MNRQIIIDAISYRGFKSREQAIELNRLGFAEDDPDQHNPFSPCLMWNRSKLQTLSMDQLNEIYKDLYEAIIEDEDNE